VEPADVGPILDSSVVIAAERRGHTVLQILEQFRSDYGETEIGLSVVTIVGIDPLRSARRNGRTRHAPQGFCG
jgi:hypothetical protein